MNLAYSDKISDQTAPQPTTRWLVTILLLGTLFIFYVTLFPFDFFLKSPPTLNEIIQNFDLDVFNIYTLEDIPRNIVLFIPIGFTLAGLLLKHNTSVKLTFIISILCGLLLSATVEVLQMYSINRFPTLGDIVANTIGTAVGFLIFTRWGQSCYSYWLTIFNRLNKKLSFPILLLSYVIFAGLLLLLSTLLRQQTTFNNWETEFPLVIGNEYTKNRAWNGFMTDMYLFDQSLDENDIAKLLHGDRPTSLQNDGLLASYNFTGNEALNFPAIEWRGTPALGRESEGALLSRRQWLVSRDGGSLISHALRDSTEFTLGFTAAPTTLDQTGPARIISISQNIHLRNLTVGQTYNDLNLRVRTPFSNENGRHPEYIIPDVFTDTELHHIILKYTGTTIQLYIDDPDNVYTLELVPAVVLFSLVPPSSIEQMRINRGNMLVFHLLYNALYLVPLAGLLVYKLRGSHYKPIWNWVSILLTTVLASLLLEVGLNLLISGYRLQTNYVLMNMPLFLCTIGYFWWLTRPRSQENLV